jgi:hypothetical protein
LEEAKALLDGKPAPRRGLATVVKVRWVPVALALVAGAAQAQFTSPQQVKFKNTYPWGFSKTAYGVYIGPYTLELQNGLSADPGKMTVDAFCVDFEARVASPWMANINNVETGDLTQTKQYARYLDVTIVRERYRAAAWLAAKMNPGNSNQWWKYHGAIWALMSQGADGSEGDAFDSDDAFWNPFARLSSLNQGYVLEKMNDAMANHGDDVSADWYVISPTSQTPSQEFIMHTNVIPEPETIILLASGLLALGAVAYFKSMV